MKNLSRVSFLTVACLLAGSASALDLCAEKNTTTFRQALEQTPELMSEIGQYLGDQMLSQINLETINLTNNINTASRGIAAVNAAKLRAIAQGVSPASAEAIAAPKIAISTAYIVDAQRKIGVRSSFLTKFGPTLKRVGAGAAAVGTFISAVDATCSFKDLYFSENHDAASQLQKAGEFTESALGGVIGIGVAANAIPGPWSLILVEASITSKLINADLSVAADITSQQLANYQSLSDRYFIMRDMPKILAGRSAQFSSTEKDKILKLAQDLRLDIDANIADLKSIWAHIAIPSGARKSILDGYATLTANIEPAVFSTQLDNVFRNTRREVEQRSSRSIPNTLNLPSTFKYPIGLTASVALQSPLPAVWNGSQASPINLTSSDDVKAIQLQAINSSNQVAAAVSLPPSRPLLPGVLAWSINLANSQNWLALGSGPYRVRAIAADAANRTGTFELGSMQITRVQNGNPVIPFPPARPLATKPLLISPQAIKVLAGSFGRPDQDSVSTENISIAAQNKLIKVANSLPYALIANDVYNNTTQLPSTAFEVIDNITYYPLLSKAASATGFYAAVYRIKATDTYAIAFRGTGPDNLSNNIFTRSYDLIADLVQDAALTIGVGTPQHLLALLYSDAAIKKLPGKPVIFVGHSLGGGLAQYSAWVYRAKGTVFNPAAVPLMATHGTNGNGANIERFIVDGEAVTAGSAAIPGLSQHFGTEFRMQGANTQYRAMDEYLRSASELPWYNRVLNSAQLADILSGFSSKHGNEGVLSNIASYGTVLQFIERVATHPMPPLAGSVNPPRDMTVAPATSFQIAGGATGGFGARSATISVMRNDGSVIANTSAPVSPITNTWSAQLSLKDPGSYKYKVQATDFTKTTTEIGSGQITVAVASGQAVVQHFQAQATPQLNRELKLMIYGVELNNAVRINVGSCGQETYELQSKQSLKFTCLPTASGAQTIGWKAAASDKDWKPLGSITINPAVGDPALGSLTQPTPGSIAVNTPWSIAGQFSGNITDIFVDFTDPAPASPSRVRVSTLNATAGTWAHTRRFPVAGSYSFKVIGLHPVTKAEIVFGSGTVAVTPAANPPTPAAPVDGMRFERETFPDNTLVDGGSRVDKSWTLQNTGNSTWSSAYCLRPQAGHPLGSAPVCVTGPVAPGQFHTFHAPLQMPPAQASNATVRQTWRLSNASGAQVGLELLVQLEVKGNAPAPVLSVVEPFTMPTAVRVGSEPWVGTLNLNLPASQVQMVLVNPQGQSQGSINWSPGTNAQQWQLRHSFTSAGIYNWTLNAQGPSGSVRRSGSVQVLAPVPTNPPGGAPTAQFNANSRVTVGQTWELLVTTSAPAAAVRLQFSNSTAPLTNLTKLSDTQFRHTQTFNSPGVLNFNVRTSFQGSPLQSSPGTVQIDAVPSSPSPQPPPPPTPIKLTPILNVPKTVQAGEAWVANLNIDEAIYSASLVFKTGRRIQFDGGPQQWVSPAAQSKIYEPGVFEYQLEVQRTLDRSTLQMFPGGVLEVRPLVGPTITPVITSAPTAEQGKPYNLTVQTSVNADKVTVIWPDIGSEQALRPLDASRTKWEYGNRLFAQASPQSFIVRAYKDGFAAPSGEARGTISVTAPNAALRLLQISGNVLKGERPFFTVAASLSVARVSLLLGNGPAVEMSGSGPNGSEQNFRTQVLAAQSGAVPYVITGLDAQGQMVGNRLTGTLAVAEPGDSLKTPNPIPAEIQQGQAVRWQFLTHQAPNEMWLEFSGTIGKLPLTGAFLDQSFNYPGGDYSYRLMRRDHLGNVFPIQGAASVLRIKPGVALPVQFTAAALNGQPIVAGAALRFKTGELIQAAVRTSSAVPNLFILIPSVPWDRDLNSSDKLQWSAGMAGLPKGSHPATLHVKLPNGQPSGNPAAVSFSIVIEDNPPPRISIQSASAIPASVKVGQSMNFVAQLSAPAAVQRAELLFPDVNVTEPMTQGGPSSWARARPMTQAGANRPYRVVLTLADGQRLQQDGVYTVLPADLPLLSLQPPAPVKVGQTMSFNAQLSTPAAVQRAELVFPDANVTEPMTQTGPTIWTRVRPMTLAGTNRPYRVVLTLVDGQRLQQDGVYTVGPADLPQLSLQPPTPGKLGQPMSFNAQLSTPAAVQGAALLFPDVNVTEPMTQAGPNSWTRVRPMTQAGNNRPYRVVVTLADGQRLQQDGVYTVVSELPLPLPLQPPAPVKAGQSMSFNAQLSMPAAVQRAELLFPDANVTEPMTQTSPSSWTRTRTMTQAGNNRPYRVVLTLASGQRFQQEGVYTVLPADLPQLSLQPPAPVKVGQAMSFNAQLSAQATVQRAELLFPDVNVTEPMTQTGPTSWTRARPMTQAGSNRPYRVALTLADGQRLQQDGVYTVAPADLPQLSLQAPAPVKAGQNMSFNAQLNMPAAVQRAELLFPDVNVTEPMTQTGPTTWTRARPMSQAGDNRPYRVALTLADGQRLQQDGVYTVMPADLPLQFNIQASPPSVRQGQTMSFNLRLNNPAMLGRAELIFPDANVTEALTQTGPDSWGRSRTMVQPGNNRPFIIRLLLRDGSSQQASGNYSVTP